MRISEDTRWYSCDTVMPTLFELAGTRSSSDCPLERKMRKRQVFSKESWLSTVTDCYSFNSTDYSDYSLFTSHGSLSESSQVNSMGLRMCTSEALRWANFAFVADGESSKSPKGEPLLRHWNDEHLDFVTTSLKCEKTQKSRDSIKFPNCTRLQWFTSTMSCWQLHRNYGLHCLHRCPFSAVRERVRHNLGFRSCLDPFQDLWSFSEWVHNHVAQLLDLIPNLCPATKHTSERL